MGAVGDMVGGKGLGGSSIVDAREGAGGNKAPYYQGIDSSMNIGSESGWWKRLVEAEVAMA